jgi:hypothetical protein
MNTGKCKVAAFVSILLIATDSYAWTPTPVADDPLVRMPGTQPDVVDLTGDSSQGCIGCHAGAEPEHWKGSMMAQAARDPIFWAGMTVAAQDAIWALGNPNAVDICIRCHFPQGWLEGRSDPVNASLMTGADFDGVNCRVCHYMYDPFYDGTYTGTREGSDWLNYWDEASALSQTEAGNTYAADAAAAAALLLFNGNNMYSNNVPVTTNYTENGGGHFYIDTGASYHRRGPLADTITNHDWHYSRYHKSKYFCGTCHDISNPVLANLGHAATLPGDGTTILPSESQPAYSYGHVERTFSEFMLSGFGTNGGMTGTGHYDPATFTTSHAGNKIATCQDCHFRDLYGEAAGGKGKPRPDTSTEHTKTGITEHRMVGGNLWVPYLLASTDSGSGNFDPTNSALLGQGPSVLTLDMTQGEQLDPDMLLDTVTIAGAMLQNSVSMTNANYNLGTSEFTLRLQNHTGHKLISGYPEGRRMFLNIKAYANDELIYEINPYDDAVGTLKGLDSGYSPNSPELSDWEEYEDELVYEVHQSSSILGVDETFHMALATHRYKDNRILPKGFRVAEARSRLCEPVWHGHSDTNYHASGNYFTQAEYEGGYDEITIELPVGTERIEAGLYYQTTSREFIEFLRNEINGTNGTLSGTGAGGDPPYIAQTNSFFSGLAAWGDTIWQLWEHNKDIPGAAPVLMTNTYVQLDVSDIDGDGIPAYWELAHFGGTTNAIAGLDSDFDGIDNLGEYIAYTIPTDSNSVFTFTADVAGTNGLTEVVAEFDSFRSRDYALLQTTNLLTGGSWTNVSGYHRGADGEMDLVHTNEHGQGMYRVRVKLP